MFPKLVSGTREFVSGRFSKGWMGGHGTQKGAEKLADSVLTRQSQSLRLTADSKSLGKTEALSFLGLPDAETEAGRAEGIKGREART
jgi:hypothetical protein